MYKLYRGRIGLVYIIVGFSFKLSAPVLKLLRSMSFDSF